MLKRFSLTFLSLFFLISSVFAQSDFQKVRINDFAGGMYSNSIADIIAPNQGASVVNVELSVKGRLSKRKGQSLFLTDVGSTAFTGLGRFDPDASTSYIVAASGTQVIAATLSDDQWTIANNGVLNILEAGNDTEFVQANKLLFVLNGQDETAWWNGALWVPGSPATTSPAIATTGAWLRNYLFLAGNPTNPDWVYFSNNLEPTVFTASDIIKINTGDGQVINRILPFRLNELIIYKERSIYVLDITGTTPLTDWTVQPITRTFGTIAPRSVVSIGNDQWFLSSNPIAIRSLVRSEFDKILVNVISTPIQDIFDGRGDIRINKQQIEKAAGVIFNDKYLLAIPVGSSTVNNLVVVYDFKFEAWYLITGWYPASWVVFDEELYYTDANDGRIIKCFSGTTGDFNKGPNVISATSPQTVGIAYTYQSRAIDFDAPENFKKLDSIEVEFAPSGNWYSIISVNLDNNGWTSIGSVLLNGNGTTLPQDLPFSLTGGGVSRKTFQLQEFGEFKKMQVMVENRASSETIELQRITIFSDPSSWRRE